MDTHELKALKELIETLEKTAKTLIEKSQGIQAIERNAKRILASTKMLQINIIDIVEESLKSEG